MATDDRIDELFASLKRRGSPGCVVAVRRGGRAIHENGYGLADIEHGVPITPDTVFHIASLSKQFTAFVLLMLAGEGMLDLDDEIRAHVAEVPKFQRRITLRHLLQHTSGLRDHFTMMKLAGWRPMDEKTEDDILGLVARQTTLNFRPGEDFNYCNTGYLLLAVAVARVTGKPFRTCVEERIFRPLGMTASLVRDDHTRLVDARARGYTPDKDRHPSLWVPNFDFAGSTSVNTTLLDISRWADHLAHPPAAAKDLVRQLTTPGTLNDGRSIRYGLGVEVDTYRGLDVVKHSGWDLGYTAHLAIYPAERVAVAILANLSTLAPEQLARRVADICLADRFPEAPPEPIALPEAELRQKAGLYRHPRTDRVQRVHLVAGVLRLTSDGPPSADSGLALQPLTATRFRGENETTEVVFDAKGLTTRQGLGVAQRFVVARPWAPRAPAEYVATYRSDELDAIIAVRLEDGQLVAKRHKWPKSLLSPAYRDAFTDDIATYLFERNRAGTIVAVVLSLDRIYHLRFDRMAGPAPRRRRRRR